MANTDFTNIIDDVVGKKIIEVLRTENRLKSVKITQDETIEKSGSIWFNLLSTGDDHFEYTTNGEQRLYTFSLRIYLKTGKPQISKSFNRMSDWCEFIKRILKDNRNYRDTNQTYWLDLTVRSIDYVPVLTEDEDDMRNVQIAELIMDCHNLEKDS